MNELQLSNPGPQDVPAVFGSSSGFENVAYWVDEDTGYPCLIRRNRHLAGMAGGFPDGVLLGYVEVPTALRSADSDWLAGEVAYSRELYAMSNSVLGFDCGHAADMVTLGGTEKDVNWVRNELKVLCSNMKRVEQGLAVKLRGTLLPPQRS